MQPLTALTSLTLPGADGARRLGRLGRVPPAPCVPGGSGAGRGRVRAGRGTLRLPRPLRDPPVAPPHCRWGTRAEDESSPLQFSNPKFRRAGILCSCQSRRSPDPIQGLPLPPAIPKSRGNHPGGGPREDIIPPVQTWGGDQRMAGVTLTEQSEGGTQATVPNTRMK